MFRSEDFKNDKRIFPEMDTIIVTEVYKRHSVKTNDLKRGSLRHNGL